MNYSLSLMFSVTKLKPSARAGHTALLRTVSVWLANLVLATQVLLGVCFISEQAAAQSSTNTAKGQCNDGVDNDGDGAIDALEEIPTLNGRLFTLTGTNSYSTEFTAAIAEIVKLKKMPRTISKLVKGGEGGILRSSNSAWTNTGSTNPVGLADLATLNEVCRIIGFKEYVSSSCRDGERSARYPKGKCNFHSPDNNVLWRFKGMNFEAESPNPKYSRTWITSITCRHFLPACSDGWDNDGDGLIDLKDAGCASANDDNEKRHDPNCSSPNSPSEGTQCSDGVDNDNDGATDFPADFSCSGTDDSNEADPRSQCQDGIDNDSDGLKDLADRDCEGAQDNVEFGSKPQCIDEIDNDEDGATDFPLDFSCSNSTDDDESSPITQCQDGVDNDSDGVTDIEDADCSGIQDNTESGSRPQCNDGVDNDGDGATDLSDADCVNIQDLNEFSDGSPALQTIEAIPLNAMGEEVPGTSIDAGGKVRIRLLVNSNAPVNWVNNVWEAPSRNLEGGGSGQNYCRYGTCPASPYQMLFAEIAEGVWVWYRDFTITKFQEPGEYTWSMSVKNAAELTSRTLKATMQVRNPDYTGDLLKIEEVSLTTSGVSSGLGASSTVNLLAQSSAPVNWLNRSFVGPNGNIYGGGGGFPFESCDSYLNDPGHICFGRGASRYFTSFTDFISKWAPNGLYFYEGISVENQAQLRSDVYLGDLSFTVSNNPIAVTPEITSIEMFSYNNGEDPLVAGQPLSDRCVEASSVSDPFRFALIIKATSNAPVNWVNSSFYGPLGNLSGGGFGASFTELSPGVWRYVLQSYIQSPLDAPKGTYYWNGISVKNEGAKTSSAYPGALSFELKSVCP